MNDKIIYSGPVKNVFPADDKHADILRLMIAKNVLDTLHRCIHAIDCGSLDGRSDANYFRAGISSLMLLSCGVLKEGIDSFAELHTEGWFKDIANFMQSNICNNQTDYFLGLQYEIDNIADKQSDTYRLLKDCLRDRAGVHFPRKPAKDYLQIAAEQDVFLYESADLGDGKFAHRHLLADEAQSWMAFQGKWKSEEEMRRDLENKFRMIHESIQRFIRVCDVFLPLHYKMKQSS